MAKTAGRRDEMVIATKYTSGYRSISVPSCPSPSLLSPLMHPLLSSPSHLFSSAGLRVDSGELCGEWEEEHARVGGGQFEEAPDILHRHPLRSLVYVRKKGRRERGERREEDRRGEGRGERREEEGQGRVEGERGVMN